MMMDQLTGELFIGGQWVPGEEREFVSHDPYRDEIVCSGRWASNHQAEIAVQAAKGALPNWMMRTIEDRITIAKQFAKQLNSYQDEFANLISRETGKPKWESLTEISACIGKVQNSIEAVLARRATSADESSEPISVVRFRPIGVFIVLGPFNLPAHLPGAHIVPALLAGNTIVFKPSEQTPAIGEFLVRLWHSAGLPQGVLNLIQGAGEVASHAVAADGVDGVLFTGSYRVGCLLHRQLAGHPEIMLVLEMGGNNPLVIDQVSSIDAAAYQTILSAYITSGQRCTCARRLIVTKNGNGDEVINKLRKWLPAIRSDDPFAQPSPFLGTLISGQAAQSMLEAQYRMVENGATVLHPMLQVPNHPAALTPGLLESNSESIDDCEMFGPLLIVQRARDLEDAIRIANQTKYGLSAGLLSDNVDAFRYFASNVRAGIVNWNRQTTGASGKLPFGGIGASGNYRPSGFYAADYCSSPIASLESHALDLPSVLNPGMEGLKSL